MSGYDSAYKGYPTYNGLATQTDPWSKTSYASDHVCKPVVVDNEGRKHPIVYNPGFTTEASITKTETVVQQQYHLPFSTEYKHSSHTKIEPQIHHGYVEDKWHHSSSPVHDRPHKVEEFFTTVQTEVSQPRKFGLLSPSYWRQSPNSAGYHGSSNTGYGDYNDKSNKDWPKPSGNTIQTGNPNSTGYHGAGNTGFGGYNDKSSKDWPKPSGNTIWNGNPNSTGYHGPGNSGYDGNYHDQNNDSKMEPTTTTSGGWARPSRTGWAAPLSTTLSRPTNDIGTAMEFLKEASKPTSVPTSPPLRYTVPNTTGHKKGEYDETIDSREASKRYGHFPPSLQPEEKYTTTIDSREAARKYRGAAVPM